jgi:hypothetical protein
LYVSCEDFADIFWNKSSNEVCSEVIQAELVLVLAADMPMVLTDEIVEPVDEKGYLLKWFLYLQYV